VEVEAESQSACCSGGKRTDAMVSSNTGTKMHSTRAMTKKNVTTPENTVEYGKAAKPWNNKNTGCSQP